MHPNLSDEDRGRLLAELRSLLGAPLQKLWLPSPQLCVLQLRLPGRNALVVLDARLSMAALSDERPTSPEGAPTSQATLRNALFPARLAGAALLEGRPPLPRLELETERGRRWLMAEQALLLVEAATRKVLWASSGALRRPGSEFPERAELPLPDAPPVAARQQLVSSAMQGEEEAGLAARRRELSSRLKARVRKLTRALQAVDEDAARASRAEGDRRRAEMLLPVASRLARGASSATVPDWSQLDERGNPLQVELQLDPSLTAAGNAARWLKKAKRYAAAAARIAARREEVVVELAQSESLLQRAQAAADRTQLARVEADAGPAAAPRVRQKDQGARLPFRKFFSGAAPILVGRSARDNDALTFRVARGNDLWLHVRGVQGAHVVVPGAGEAPDARVLGDAALLAVHFSSARGSDGVEVSWTRCKHVRRPKGAAPGSVFISQEKTLRARLDAERLAALLRSEG